MEENTYTHKSTVRWLLPRLCTVYILYLYYVVFCSDLRVLNVSHRGSDSRRRVFWLRKRTRGNYSDQLLRTLSCSHPPSRPRKIWIKDERPGGGTLIIILLLLLTASESDGIIECWVQGFSALLIIHVHCNGIRHIITTAIKLNNIYSIIITHDNTNSHILRISCLNIIIMRTLYLPHLVVFRYKSYGY